VWWFKKYRNPAEHPALTGAELQHIRSSTGEQIATQIPWFKLFSYRQTWAFAIAKFLTDPIWWFYLFWLPSFFHSRFNLDLSHLGLPLIIVYNVSVIGSIVGGWLPALFRFSADPVRARQTAMLICACLVLPIFRAGHLKSEWAAVALLSLRSRRIKDGRQIFLPFPQTCFRRVLWAQSLASAACWARLAQGFFR
jgi:ACS family hexuronate transporter-like MFS transporter